MVSWFRVDLLQVRTVLEAEVLENEDFDWARPMTDLSKGRFTVEDLCTVYMNDRKRPSTSPAPYRTFQVPGLADLDMEDLKEATAAAIAAAEERCSGRGDRSRRRFWYPMLVWKFKLMKHEPILSNN
eukprot:g11261.t1